MDGAFRRTVLSLDLAGGKENREMSPESLVSVKVLDGPGVP